MRYYARKSISSSHVCYGLFTFYWFCSYFVSAAGTTYYVDSVAGNDYNDGTSTNTPWKTLTKVNSVTFAAGDQILLKADSLWSSQLVLHGSGTSATPNKVGVYGTGNKPKINAGGIYANQNAAVLLDNVQYWEIDGLEITNNDNVVNANWHNGIVVSAMDYGTVNHIYITNCYLHDIGQHKLCCSNKDC